MTINSLIIDMIFYRTAKFEKGKSGLITRIHRKIFFVDKESRITNPEVGKEYKIEITKEFPRFGFVNVIEEVEERYYN